MKNKIWKKMSSCFFIEPYIFTKYFRFNNEEEILVMLETTKITRKT